MGLLRLDQETRFAIGDDLRNSTNPGANHGCSPPHRFWEYQPERFINRRSDEDVGGLEPAVDLGLRQATEHLYPTSHFGGKLVIQKLSMGPPARTMRSIAANEHEPGIRNAAKHEWYGF